MVSRHSASSTELDSQKIQGQRSQMTIMEVLKPLLLQDRMSAAGSGTPDVWIKARPRKDPRDEGQPVQ